MIGITYRSRRSQTAGDRATVQRYRRTRRRVAQSLMVLTVTLGLMVPLAGGATTAEGGVSGGKRFAGLPPTSDPSSKAEARVNEVSNAIFDDVSGLPGYGGVWVDHNGLTHVAFQHDEVQSVDNALHAKYAGEYVVDQHKFTYAELIARRDEVTTRLGELRRAGLDPLDWGPDEQNDTIWLSLRNFTPEAADKARTLLGEDVRIEPSPTNGGIDDLFSRSSDSEPHAAGIYLYPT